ncbi:hypothetical protein [Rhizobium sp. BR 314]|uniref:hypothetical protein n=1 Tax=Rhizobium sp. BR 314 TaxID=3040013 RepID=UPI0039BF44D3
MLTPVNSFSSTAALSILVASNPAATSASQSANQKSGVLPATGNTDDVFKAGNAIGKIIEIVAGLNKNNSSQFTMDGAQRTDSGGGVYTETKTGQGTVGSDVDSDAHALQEATAAAAGTGPQADEARAYLKAAANGTIQKTDMSAMGVTSTMTRKVSYYADGRERGSSISWNTQGLDAFLQNYTTKGDDGLLHDKATGKYAGIAQNGTQFTYVTW